MESRPFYRLRCSGAKSSATAVSARQGSNAVSAIAQAMERRGLALLIFTSRKMLTLSSGKEIGRKS